MRIRSATAPDVAAIVALLADDVLGQNREQPGDPAYHEAFACIDADPQQLLVVAEDDDGIIGTLQLSLIPGLSHRGMLRAQIESVRVRSDRRSSGAGQQLIEWAVATAKEHGAGLVQLTSNATRERAHQFYERLGFQRTHVGMKRDLR